MPIDLFMLPIGLAHAGVIALLNRYSQLGGLTRGVSFFFIVYAAVMMAVCFSLGRLWDRRGDDPIIAIDLACLTISLFVLVFAATGRYVIAAGVFCSLGYGVLMLAC